MTQTQTQTQTQIETRTQRHTQAPAQAQATGQIDPAIHDRQAVLPGLAAACLAVDPVGLGGVVLRAMPGPAREAWLALSRALMPPSAPWRRIPLNVDEERLLGGLDLPATLRAGRPVAQRGLLAEADGGMVVLPSAERLAPAQTCLMAGALDTHEVVCERQGISSRLPARWGVIALDEGAEPAERVPARLAERLAMHLTLDPRAAPESAFDAQAVQRARERLAAVELPDEVLCALAQVAHALGVDSLRATVAACRVARALAALAGETRVTAEQAGWAAALVLAPRATRRAVPEAADPPPENRSEPSAPAATDPQPQEHKPEAASPPPDHLPDATLPPPDDQPEAASPQLDAQPLGDRVLEAAQAALPRDLLESLLGPQALRTVRSGAAGAGDVSMSRWRGRPIGARRGDPARGARLHLMATLRAAAVWQTLRARERPGLPPPKAGRGTGSVTDRAKPASGGEPKRSMALRVTREDFHIWRYRQRSETTTVFAVDASGSAALHRLAEAKGAVERLLADCYVRRDSVALVAFRGQGADILLAPTRSLARARRNLAALPGGGGTPLAAGVDAALSVCLGVRKRGATPLLVVLTDGRANIGRDGAPGRDQARRDALAAATRVRREAVTAMVIDTSRESLPPARELAQAMGAHYLALPYAASADLSRAVRQAATRNAA